MLRKQQRGVAMIEVLVAIVLLSVGIVGYMSLQALLLEESAINEARTEAIHIAAQRLDSLRDVAYADLTDSDETDTNVEANNTTLKRTTIVGTERYSNPAYYRPVTVNVSWTDSNGGVHSIGLSTFHSDQSSYSSDTLIRNSV
tara:strand:- start:80817 stop:81245 length:429 start_codon:yes stop_codon:yes gene_type:complete